jgi:pSer/pThr/pTyr-binding forkhead associated (FHA) protein
MPASVCVRCNNPLPSRALACPMCGQPIAGAPQRAAPPRPKVGFRVVPAEGGPENVVPMKGEALTCGKKGDIPLPQDPFVAEVQARFFFQGAKLTVEDVGGNNGTFFRLRIDRDLKGGSELRMGRQRLVLEPLGPVKPGADGATAWGSPDSGCRFRFVQIFEGGIRGAAYTLKEGDNFIGRETGDITFPTDGFVSGKHAVVRVVGEQVTIKDVGSSNGTFVRLQGPTGLDQGDQLLVGKQLLKVELQP